MTGRLGGLSSTEKWDMSQCYRQVHCTGAEQGMEELLVACSNRCLDQG